MRQSRPLTRLLTKILRCVPTDFHAVGLPSFASPPGEGESDGATSGCTRYNCAGNLQPFAGGGEHLCGIRRSRLTAVAAVDLPQLMIERTGRILIGNL
jgi:hypothetical protein